MGVGVGWGGPRYHRGCMVGGRWGCTVDVRCVWLVGGGDFMFRIWQIWSKSCTDLNQEIKKK